MAFKIGDLFWKIKGETSDVDKKLNDTDNKAGGLQGTFGKLQNIVSKAAPWVAAGAAIIAVGKKVFQLGVQAGQAADKLLDLTEITGLNTDTLQELQFIAADAGVNFDGLTGAVTKFTARIPQIESGTGDVAEAFNSLGVNLRDTTGEIRNQDELFPELIKSLQNIENTTERNAIAQQLFGRSLNDLAPVLGLTNEEFENLRDSAAEAGAVVGEDALVAANDFRRELDAAKLAADQAKVALGAQFAPILSSVVIPIVETATSIITGLAGAIQSLNDLLFEPDDRESQIARELDFLEAKIEQTELLTMLTEDQRRVLIENYEQRITELRAELRGLALVAESEKTATEETKNETAAIVEQTAAVEEQNIARSTLYIDAINNVAELERAEIEARNKIRLAILDQREATIQATKAIEDQQTAVLDLSDLADTAIGGLVSGFEDLGVALFEGEDTAEAWGEILLDVLADVLRGLGAQLLAIAAVKTAQLALGPGAALAGAAAAFLAAGIVSAAADNIGEGVTETITDDSTSSSDSSSSSSGSSSSSSSTSDSTTFIAEVYLDGEKIASSAAPYLVSELERRGDF